MHYIDGYDYGICSIDFGWWNIDFGFEIVKNYNEHKKIRIIKVFEGLPIFMRVCREGMA